MNQSYFNMLQNLKCPSHPKQQITLIFLLKTQQCQLGCNLCFIDKKKTHSYFQILFLEKILDPNTTNFQSIYSQQSENYFNQKKISQDQLQVHIKQILILLQKINTETNLQILLFEDFNKKLQSNMNQIDQTFSYLFNKQEFEHMFYEISQLDQQQITMNDIQIINDTLTTHYNNLFQKETTFDNVISQINQEVQSGLEYFLTILDKFKTQFNNINSQICATQNAMKNEQIKFTNNSSHLLIPSFQIRIFEELCSKYKKKFVESKLIFSFQVNGRDLEIIKREISLNNQLLLILLTKSQQISGFYVPESIVGILNSYLMDRKHASLIFQQNQEQIFNIKNNQKCLQITQQDIFCIGQQEYIIDKEFKIKQCKKNQSYYCPTNIGNINKFLFGQEPEIIDLELFTLRFYD